MANFDVDDLRNCIAVAKRNGWKDSAIEAEKELKALIKKAGKKK